MGLRKHPESFSKALIADYEIFLQIVPMKIVKYAYASMIFMCKYYHKYVRETENFTKILKSVISGFPVIYHEKMNIFKKIQGELAGLKLSEDVEARPRF